MTEAECAKVLAKIQLVDNRQVDRLTLAEWFDIIGHLDFKLAVEAVRIHRQTSTDYLQPAHIVQIVQGLARVSVKASTSVILAEIEEARSKSVPMPEQLRKQMFGGSDE